MSFVKKLFLGSIVLLIAVAAMNAQQSVSSATVVVPRLVSFSGAAIDEQGRPIAGIVGISFAIYNGQEGGAPLWMETQNVQADAKGNYAVQLGAATSQGLPLDLFTSGEARWLGVRVNGGEEQPRVLLLSVPYALKAADAQTLGGLPASAFALAAPGGSTAPAPADPVAQSSTGSSATIGGGGTQDYIPIWTDGNGDLGNSILYQSGSGSSAKIGVNITKPLFTLDVNGQELVRGLFEMATTNYASKTKGYDSQPLNFESSAFNSTSGTYTLNHFQWQAEPTGNDTATPGATLNLLYGTDPALPSETGLQLSSKGLFTFATGQTFPGAGTITGVTTASGSGLSGGGTSGNLNLTLVNTCAANQVLQWNGSAWACSSAGTGTITGVTAGRALTGGGTSGNVTLSLDVTKVPLLAASNFFTAPQNVTSSSTAIAGTSASPGSVGVYGIAAASSGGSNGVVGATADPSGAGVEGINQTAAPGTGVLGLSTGGGVGVYGQSGNGGYGVYGTTAGTDSYAVYGQNQDTGDFGADGVHGVANSPTGSGVAGLNNNGGYGVYGAGGIGVYGTGSSYGFQTDSNVQQARTAGGWVKAMMFVNGTQAPYSIVRCFNSTLAGAAATTPPCGITFTEVGGPGNWEFVFNFEVDDRFYAAMLYYNPSGANVIWEWAQSPDTLFVVTQDSTNSFKDQNASFSLIVF